jgi:hypothetical protein
MSYYLENNIIFTFWTGKNAMSDERKSGLASIEKNTRCTVKLVTPRNLDEFILDDHPIHPAYKYLSVTQRSDYLRGYFMHHWGGGYADIKQIDDRWDIHFESLRNSPDFYATGYVEADPRDVAPFAENKRLLMENHDQLIGNCAFVFKPDTEFTLAWYSAQSRLLDENFTLLKKHPARFATDCFDAPSENRLLRRYNLGRSRYPIRWTGLQGDLFHPLCYDYRDRISKDLPPPDFSVAYR